MVGAPSNAALCTALIGALAWVASATDTCADERTVPDDLYTPSSREAHYGQNVARYLVDLHDANATFDFCGGMLFQLVLSPSLYAHFSGVAAGGGSDPHQPVVYERTINKMHRLPGYTKDASADRERDGDLPAHAG